MTHNGLHQGVPPLDRFLARRTIDENGCWLIRGTGSSGYSMIMVDGRRRLAHRWAYEHFVGPIPDGLEIDHTCRVRACSNPDHLEPVTKRENIRRSDNYLGRNMRKVTCPRGHPYSGTVNNKGRVMRVCHTCQRDAVARYRARKEAAHNLAPRPDRSG